MKNLKIRNISTHIIWYNKGRKLRVILDTELSDSNYEFQIGSKTEHEYLYISELNYFESSNLMTARLEMGT